MTLASARLTRTDVLGLSDHGLVSTAQTIGVPDTALAARGREVRVALPAVYAGGALAPTDKPAAARIMVDSGVPNGSPCKDVADQARTPELWEPCVRGLGGAIAVIHRGASAQAANLIRDVRILSDLSDPATKLAPGYTG